MPAHLLQHPWRLRVQLPGWLPAGANLLLLSCQSLMPHAFSCISGGFRECLVSTMLHCEGLLLVPESERMHWRAQVSERLDLC